MFEELSKGMDLPALENDVLDFWAENHIERRYLERNEDAEERYSFLDGPITANGPMGVHHAWGRTYKDLWQRYNTMLGKRQRYQNGFDCQGLWVEVTVERQLGFKSKRDIESYGVAEFVRACKEDVFKWSDLQTRQSRRLGYFMDWDNSYFTLSDENNYTIWHFLKQCHERGLLYKGTDVMTWCTRCGTGISDAEAAEGYEELTHRSVYARFPLVGRVGEYLLVWTTTPWTLSSNVAVAVNPDLAYVRARDGDDVYYLARDAVKGTSGKLKIEAELQGRDLLGWRYIGPFDDVPASERMEHRVIPWSDVSAEEGTGLVHIAPGCGKEDLALGREFGLPVIAPLDESGAYLPGFGWLSGRNVEDVAEDIVSDLERKNMLFRVHDYVHRYPTCWRCKTPLVFRLVDEWFIAMDALRQPMMEVVRKIRWLPPFGMERELDWLRNMGDWMISKKRYWGLALPIWECPDGHVEVIGSKEELFDRALSGTEHLESPHRPWVDEITIPCATCGQVAHRIRDVGNPWLDAGIVPYSTVHYRTDPEYWSDWFPVHFITESFPGQFRNWFYSMLAMSTVLENKPPFLNVLGYATLKDQSGREMHKSWGNLIPFDEAAERAGADSMRWLFALQTPEMNLNFGWETLDEIKRRLLTLWNTCKFFLSYASLDRWTPGITVPIESRSLLDRWALARLDALIIDVRTSLSDYDAQGAARAIETFIEDLSTWYVRRSRSRFWKSEADVDKNAAYATLYECLATVLRLMAPFVPFLTEYLYQRLVRPVDPDAAISVHLTSYPETQPGRANGDLLRSMHAARQVVALGHAARERVNIKVRQPLSRIWVKAPTRMAENDIVAVADIILDELNVRHLEIAATEAAFLTYSVRPNLPLLGPKYGKLVPRIRQQLEALEPASVVQAIESGRTVIVAVDGDHIELDPDEILTSAGERVGYTSMAGEGYVVVLDTQLSPDLIAEGLAREVIRRLNDWRKQAGFRIEDRIEVSYQATPLLAEAIERHRESICRETLATTLRSSSSDGHGYYGEADFNEHRLVARLLRTAGEV